MKKLLTLLGVISLSASATSTVIACGEEPKINEQKPEEETPTPELSADEILIKKFNDLLSKTLVVDTIVETKNQNVKNLQKLLKTEKNITQQKEDIINKIIIALNLDEKVYKVTIEDSDFLSPEILNINEQGQITTSTKINLGKITVNLFKGNEKISTKTTSWIIETYELVQATLDLLNVQNKNNEFDILLGSFDIPVLGELKITLGTLSSLIELLPILESLSPNVFQALDTIKNLDLKALSQFDPLANEGQNAYFDFENKFITSFETIFKELSKLLASFGISDSIKINDQEIKISDFLDVNLFDLFGIKKEQINLNIDSGIPIAGEIPIKIDVKTGNEYGITIRAILLNIAPDLVKFLNFALNSDSYQQSNNLIFELIKYFLSDVDNDLKVINEKNFKSKIDKNNNEYNYNKAVTNLDSLFYNFISSFNSNKRGEKGNFSIKINLEKKILFSKLKLDSYINNLLARIYINPTNILMTVINNLLKYDKDLANGVTVNSEKSIFGDLKIIESLDIKGLVEDGNSIPKIVGPFLTPENLNPAVLGMLPEISINSFTNLLINLALPSLLDKENNNITEWIIEGGLFNIMFLNNENKWVSLSEGLSGDTRLNNFKNIKISFTNIQLSGKYISLNGIEMDFLTNDDLSFTLMLSKKNN